MSFKQTGLTKWLQSQL